MFEHLKEFDHVLVSGPQRSGTTICGKMIADDTGFKYVDEFQFGVHNIVQLKALIAEGVGKVFQCPGICRYLDHIATDRIAIVLMRRDIKDILASQDRIKWNCDGAELMKYQKYERFESEIISEIKYKYFDAFQRFKIPHLFDVQYESLSQHPLWIEKEKRKNFHAKQTELVDRNLNNKLLQHFVPNYQI